MQEIGPHSSELAVLFVTAFGQLFSEKFFRDAVFWSYRMCFDVEPELGALRLNDVDVSSVNGTHTALGRLSIW